LRRHTCLHLNNDLYLDLNLDLDLNLNLFMFLNVSADSEFPGITDLEFPTLAEGSEIYG